MNKKTALMATGSLIIITAVSGGAVHAKSVDGNTGLGRGQSEGRGLMGNGLKMGQGVDGKITAINGTVITLAKEIGTTTKTYTVDAGKAVITKHTEGSVALTDKTQRKNNLVTIAFSDLKVSDMIMVKGTVNGTNVTATEITVNPFGKNIVRPQQKINVGTLQSVSGTTLTVLAKAQQGRMMVKTDNSNTVKTDIVYTVDVASAKIEKVASVGTNTAPTRTQISVTDLKVNDTLRIEGDLTGTNIKATVVTVGEMGMGLDRQNKMETRINESAEGKALKAELEAMKPGMWNKVMGFFSGMFGKR